MKYVYFKDKKGNFGDDLNYWLWPKFFGAEDDSDNTLFLGIGTILYNGNAFLQGIKDNKKIVFGTGIRPTYENFKIDNSWDIRFLRGPFSSAVFNDQFDYIADGAYALALLKDFDAIKNQEKKYKISYMPYFKSVPYLNWEQICQELGFNYISPFCENGIEHTLKEIAASELVITEAMHGAIVADVLRVPWRRFVLSTPVTEGGMVSEFKWMDWLYSIGIKNSESDYVKMYKKSVPHKVIDKLSFKSVHIQFFIKNIIKKEVMKKLSAAKNEQFYIAKDNAIETINNRMNEKIITLAKERNFI